MVELSAQVQIIFSPLFASGTPYSTPWEVPARDLVPRHRPRDGCVGTLL